ncbi:MAG TPA: MBL fold metallo-hydrolase [Gemmatimonadaceae bacterium]|nr:MBL fold metallo-hydrolase [Gemmatimonadaceae bacterium]
MRVHRVPLQGTNAYVITGDHHVLVDTGAERARTALLDGLAGMGLGGEDLSLVIATHAHATSVGNAAYLQRVFHVPVAVHAADAPILASGIDRTGGIAKPLGALLRLFGDIRFEAAPPDVVFGHTLSLEPFGCEGAVVHTPGHTIGSTSIVLPTGDAIIGDLLMGGWLGGRVLPRRPTRHYLAEQPDRVLRSLALLHRLGVKRMHPGTGDVLQMDEVWRRLIATADSIPSGPAPARVRERRLADDDEALHLAS